MKYVFARNINNMGMDGIIDPDTQTLLCLCHEKQSQIILDALAASSLLPTSTDAVEFAEWVTEQGFRLKEGYWYNHGAIRYTTSQLYKLFKERT